MENIKTIDFVYLYLSLVKENPKPTQGEVARRLGTNPVALSRAINANQCVKPEWIPAMEKMLMEVDMDRYEATFLTLKKRHKALQIEQQRQKTRQLRETFHFILENFLATAFKDKQYTACRNLYPSDPLSRFSFRSDNGEKLVFQYIDNSKLWTLLLNDPSATRFYMFTEDVDIMQDLITHYNDYTTAATQYPWIKRSILLIDMETQTVIAENPI